MANPSVTYSFTNGTSADGSQVNTNFTDLINAMTDGTKSFSIDALTVAGTFTANGNVTLGNASSDDITFTGSVASTIPVKTNSTYNFGSSTLGLLSVYLGNNSQTVRLTGSSSMSATYTFTLPVNSGTKGYGLLNGGSATMAWTPMQTDVHSVSSADYTVLDDDGYAHVHVTTGASTRTITLPTAAANTDRRITIRKVDTGAGLVTIDGEGAETIGSYTSYTLTKIHDRVTLLCDGTGWHVLESRHGFVSFTPSWTDPSASVGFSTVVSLYQRVGNCMHLPIAMDTTGAASNSGEVYMTIPDSLTADLSANTILGSATLYYSNSTAQSDDNAFSSGFLIKSATPTRVYVLREDRSTTTGRANFGVTTTAGRYVGVAGYAIIPILEWAQ
jgi:hypothetical protein